MTEERIAHHASREPADAAPAGSWRPPEWRGADDTEQIAYRHGLRDAQLALRHRSIMTTTTHYLTDALKPNMTDGLF